MIRWNGIRTAGLTMVLALIPQILLAQGPAEEQAVIAGLVMTEAGAPLEGVHVQVVRSATRGDAVTGEDGTFQMAVPPGEYEVHVVRLGYRPEERTVQLEAGEREVLRIILSVEALGMDRLVVAASRTSAPLETVPGAVTVVSRAELEAQSRLSSNLGDLLAQTVPGLGQGVQSGSLFGQSLRGRGVAVLIDGVPQTTTRNVSRDLSTIDPAVVERVEVLRGATSIYGEGATGGVINIVTRASSGGDVRLTTRVATEAALSAPGEGFGPSVLQRAEGGVGAFDFSVSGLFERTGSYFDAEGDMTPPDPHGQGGLADTDSWDLHARLGWDLGGERLQLTANRYHSEQRTPFLSDPSVTSAEPGTQKAVPMDGLQLAEDQGTENTVVSLDYRDADLLGSRLSGQLYVRDYTTTFRPFDGRRYRSTGFQVMQSYLDSEKVGGRLTVETPLGGPELVWGADYVDETTSQPVYLFDEDVYDASGGLVFERTGTATWVPEMNPRQLGLFAQLGWTLDRVHLRAGVRHERATVHVADFTTLAGTPVTGGELSYDPVLLNAGATLDLTSELSVYGSFSQGFSLADVGLYLRSPPDTVSYVVGNMALDAQTVDQYEAGVRFDRATVSTSLAGYYNTSELGTRSGGFDMAVIRAPERVYGVEATLDARPTRTLGVGGTFSWTEGDWLDEERDTYYTLNSWRIQPWKLTAHVQHATEGGWENRLQALWSGSRDMLEQRPDPTTAARWGERPIEGYFLVDWLSSLELGPGTLELGVHNLLNNQYFPVVAQLMRTGTNTSYTAGRGATLSVGYTLTY
jgi:iron complex outermembrane receptor protein